MLATRRHIGAMSRPSWAADSSALQSRSNSIRNNAMVGAVPGTPGTAPTNWTPGATGLTIELASVGTEASLEYVDYRFSGTTGAVTGQINFEASNIIAALNGQTWTGSFFAKLVAGSMSNVTGFFMQGSQRDGAFAAISSITFGASIHATITSRLTRYAGSAATNSASTAFLLPFIVFTWSNGVAVDFTIRLARPQLELGPVASSPIRTSTAARLGMHTSMVGRS